MKKRGASRRPQRETTALCKKNEPRNDSLRRFLRSLVDDPIRYRYA